MTYTPEYPVTVNDEAETTFAGEVIDELFGDQRHLRWTRPLSASEDFSFVLEEVPGTFVGLAAPPEGADLRDGRVQPLAARGLRRRRPGRRRRSVCRPGPLARLASSSRQPPRTGD